MKKNLLLLNLMLLSTILFSQVGIGTNTPTKTLDVNGNAIIRNNLNIIPSGISILYEGIEFNSRAGNPRIFSGNQLEIQGNATSGKTGVVIKGNQTSGNVFEVRRGNEANTPAYSFNVDGHMTFHELTGTGNAYACFDANGRLYRYDSACN